MPKTVMYVRVSTADQTIEHQQTQAEEAGFVIDKLVSDEGVSGVSVPLFERDGGKRLNDLLRDGDTLVVRWIDRLGRNYDDMSKSIRQFLDTGITIKTVIHSMVFDAHPPTAMEKAVRDALLGFMSAMAEAQAQSTREAQRAGIAHARATKPKTAYRGRKPSFTEEQLDEVVSLFGQGVGVNEIARTVGLSKFAVSRLTRDSSKGYEMLSRWKDEDISNV